MDFSEVEDSSRHLPTFGTAVQKIIETKKSSSLQLAGFYGAVRNTSELE